MGEKGEKGEKEERMGMGVSVWKVLGVEKLRRGRLEYWGTEEDTKQKSP